MAELVDLFVSELPRKIESLRAAFERGEAADLARLAHQIKGAADGYGFASITEAAAAVEGVLRRGDGGDGGPESALEAVRTQLDGLIELCARAAQGRS